MKSPSLKPPTQKGRDRGPQPTERCAVRLPSSPAGRPECSCHRGATGRVRCRDASLRRTAASAAPWPCGHRVDRSPPGSTRTRSARLGAGITVEHAAQDRPNTDTIGDRHLAGHVGGDRRQYRQGHHATALGAGSPSCSSRVRVRRGRGRIGRSHVRLRCACLPACLAAALARTESGLWGGSGRTSTPHVPPPMRVRPAPSRIVFSGLTGRTWSRNRRVGSRDLQRRRVRVLLWFLGVSAAWTISWLLTFVGFPFFFILLPFLYIGAMVHAYISATNFNRRHHAVR